VLYEYRRYEAMPGRLPDLHRRFREITLGLWERHGIEQVGFWEASVGVTNELHYLLRWQDMADREAKWAAFQADPEWHQARAKTEANGPIVRRVENAFWAPTDYSKLP
jgi:hypothetical protein